MRQMLNCIAMGSNGLHCQHINIAMAVSSAACSLIKNRRKRMEGIYQTAGPWAVECIYPSTSWRESGKSLVKQSSKQIDPRLTTHTSDLIENMG